MNLPGNERTISRWNNSVSEKVRARLRATAFPKGSIIFPKIGAAIATNKKRVLTRPSCVDNNVMALVPDRAHIEPEYLYYLMLTKDLRDFASDSNPPSIRKTTVEAWRIPVPPLDEQRRIVDILSRAEGIVRLRREAQKKAAELVPAIFLEMFGDPATNPKGWPIRPLGEIADVQGGLQVTSARAALPLEVPYLRVANVHRGRLDLGEVKMLRVAPHELARASLATGDLLIVEGHGNPLEIGRVAVWDGSIPDCTHQNHLIRARPVPSMLLPEYASACLNSHGGRQALLRSGKTTSGLSTISVKNVKNAPIMAPPIALQQKFAVATRQTLALQHAQRLSGASAAATMGALLRSLLG